MEFLIAPLTIMRNDCCNAPTAKCDCNGILCICNYHTCEYVETCSWEGTGCSAGGRTPPMRIQSPL